MFANLPLKSWPVQSSKLYRPLLFFVGDYSFYSGRSTCTSVTSVFFRQYFSD